MLCCNQNITAEAIFDNSTPAWATARVERNLTNAPGVPPDVSRPASVAFATLPWLQQLQLDDCPMLFHQKALLQSHRV